jgi:hypothetical protein
MRQPRGRRADGCNLSGLRSLATRITPHSRGAIAPGRCIIIVPRKQRGRRECRALSRTHSLVCSKKAHEFETTGEPKHPAFPAQWFTAYRALSPVYRAFLATVVSRNVSQDLIPASGDQDHTPLPSAFAYVRLTQRTRPSHPAANVRDDRDTSLLWSRTRKLRPLICPTTQEEFLARPGVRPLNPLETVAEIAGTRKRISEPFWQPCSPSLPHCLAAVSAAAPSGHGRSANNR